jgi:signal transduction histidine kinase
MRSFITILLFFFFGIQFCKAQDTTIVLSSAMLDKTTDLIDISALNGWIFKHENDTGFSNISIDPTGWQHLKPSELSSKLADKNGRVEGWFRIKIKLDSSLLSQQIGFDFGSWAAFELYIDGKMIAARGDMGENGKPFRDYLGDMDAVMMRSGTSAPHIFVLHFAGYLSPLPPHELKATTPGNQLFVLEGPNFNFKLLKRLGIVDAFTTLWLVVCSVLTLLFWLLLFQNRQEKNLFWIALYTTVLTLLIYCSVKQTSLGISFIPFKIYGCISSGLIGLILLVIIPILLAKVFNRKLNRKLLVTLLILSLSLFLCGFLLIAYSFILRILAALSILLALGICFYYVITSWKSTKGAQWAIVVGIIASIFSLIVGFVLTLISKNFNNSLYLQLLTYSCFVLSFPLSLLIYVSIRFKEIIKEVRQNAAQVVSLSEEKKEHAVNQQKILQEEVNRQTTEIRHTLDNLKSTQSQLIQSEKMASLGELTAGIAHEIQNPLNFVNNFSDVNKELLQELKEEADKGNIEDVKAIADNVIGNEEKINHHGKRADAIVKGMLQHSRKSSGQKEATDINTLADEYLRLSYHGLRAKDKNFNAEIKTDLDKSIGKINIIPQDIGRVLLNLFNNAFYAVNEQKNSNSISYYPTVFVKTEKCDDKIYITVKDNGKGIPQKIIDKIFQPFFTTKPTGQGTGLGLSLSYDIIKAHGGEIKVETMLNAETPGSFLPGTTFTITLPTKA